MNSEKWSVLIVEDDLSLAENLKIGLEQENFEIFVAQNRDEAIKLFLEKKPMIVLSDINLSYKENGLDVLAELKMQSSVISTFVVMTGQMFDSSYIKTAMKLGSVEYLYKPFSLKDLQNIMFKAGYLTVNKRKLENMGPILRKIALSELAFLKN